MTRDRNPWLAVLLSVLAPGLGHLYAGSVRQALSWYVGAVALSALLVVALVNSAFGGLALIAALVSSLGILVAVAATAALLARRAPRPYELRSFNRWWVYLIALLGSSVLSEVTSPLPYLKRHYEAFRIPSGSMEPNLLIGDFLFVIKPLRHARERGAIVVFSSVEDPGLKAVKRIVAVTGDTIQMRAGRFVLRGVPAVESHVLSAPGRLRSETPAFRERMRLWQEPYLTLPDTGYAPDLNNWGPLVVPAASVFVLGDNREASYDSRYWGFLPVTSIIGQPDLIYYSYDSRAQRGLPWLTAVRWDRIGLKFP